MPKQTAVIRLRIPETLMAVSSVQRHPGHLIATVSRQVKKKTVEKKVRIQNEDLIYLTKNLDDYTILHYVYSDTCVTSLAKPVEANNGICKITRRPDGKVFFAPTSSVLILEE